MSRPRAQRDGSYVVDASELASGSTLGGPDLCLTLKADGSIDRVHSLAAGATLLSGLSVAHWSLDDGIRLAREDGTFTLSPAAQTYRYRLGEAVSVEETVFVLDDGGAFDACYAVFRLRNEGTREARIASAIFARIAAAMTGAEVEAGYEERLRALIVRNRTAPYAARALTISCDPASWSVSASHARALDERWGGPFDCRIDASGSDPLGTLHVEHTIPCGGETSYAVALVALPQGSATADQVVAGLPAAADALAATRRRYDDALARSVVLAPDREVERGAHWAKANMLRVMRRAPAGLGFSNDPGNSNACVARDAAWFVHGCDWLDPGFSGALLRGFAARQERDGKIVEWFDLRSGETYDDGLNVNDDTPLFVLALRHHVAATGDRSALAELYDAAVRAGQQLLDNRDPRGLVWCSSTQTGARGIVGWRNIIDGYRISGATTELNSLAYAAFRALAELAALLGHESEQRRWNDEATALHAAIERHLRNPLNGLYYLCIDVDGSARDEITADLVFPVMFGVSDEVTSARIVTRLQDEGFWSAAGLRTVPRGAPEYDPARADGLLGGVWVGVTFWYAFAAATFVPDIMAEALAIGFRHYAADPKRYNTVPGQFSEWLHGETLANRGMQLSPWFPPRYLWAAVEGACGLRPGPERARIAPNVPPSWSWLAVRNVPFHGTPCTWIVARIAGGLRLFATARVESDLALEHYDRDVTSDVHVAGDEVAVVALARDARALVFLGNREDHTVSVAIRGVGSLEHCRAIRHYDPLRDAWFEQIRTGGESIAVSIARGSFAFVEFVTVQVPGDAARERPAWSST